MFGIKKLRRRIAELEIRLDLLQQQNKQESEESEAFIKAQQAMQDGIMNILSYGGGLNGKRAE